MRATSGNNDVVYVDKDTNDVGAVYVDEDRGVCSRIRASHLTNKCLEFLIPSLRCLFKTI